MPSQGMGGGAEEGFGGLRPTAPETTTSPRLLLYLFKVIFNFLFPWKRAMVLKGGGSASLQAKPVLG